VTNLSIEGVSSTYYTFHRPALSYKVRKIRQARYAAAYWQIERRQGQ